ncbi:MAG: hypothetical protein IJI98_09115 [Methanosphaera sp.]|nr:hypothetical protein [Methanosphaera sp.]
MFNKRIENFLNTNKLSISPLDYHKPKEKSYTKRRYGSRVITFHDMNGIQHYIFHNKDYRRKTLHVKIAYDMSTREYPSGKRIYNLKNIIRNYINKSRILSEKTTNNDKKYEIKYEILFTANNTLKSYQYWIDELAYTINDNSNILLDELSLSITRGAYKKIIPEIETNQFRNRKIWPVKDNLDKLNDFQLALIGRDYQKEKILPPYELAVELHFPDEFFNENKDYYEKEVTVYAHNFLKNIMHAKVLKEEEDMSSIKWH